MAAAQLLGNEASTEPVEMAVLRAVVQATRKLASSPLRVASSPKGPSTQVKEHRLDITVSETEGSGRTLNWTPDLGPLVKV